MRQSSALKTLLDCALILGAAFLLLGAVEEARGQEPTNQHLEIQRERITVLGPLDRAADSRGVKRDHSTVGGRPLTACLPKSIREALARVDKACGIRVISTHRPGAIIAGTNTPSMHATCRAADFTSKDYACVYQTLSGWRGKLSTDYRIGHVHIDDGRYARFVHGGQRKRLARAK